MPERRRIIDSYKMGRQIGNGYFGRVYICTHQNTKAAFAAKWIYKIRHPDPSVDIRAIFDTELRAMQRVKNQIPFSFPHLVRLIHLVDRDDAWVLITDLGKGGDLETKYILPQNPPPLSELRLGEIILDVVLGLKELHQIGLAHRDIKPGNIVLLTSEVNSRLAICDFGFCRDYRNGLVGRKGTPEFMAPEIHLHQEHEALADMWAVGITMFNLWFDKFPWRVTNDRVGIISEVVGLKEGWLDVGGCLSRMGTQFMEQCLILDPLKRLSARDALRHPFLRRASDAIVRRQAAPNAHVGQPQREMRGLEFEGVTAEDRERRMWNLREGSHYLWK